MLLIFKVLSGDIVILLVPELKVVDVKSSSKLPVVAPEPVKVKLIGSNPLGLFAVAVILNWSVGILSFTSLTLMD